MEQFAILPGSPVVRTSEARDEGGFEMFPWEDIDQPSYASTIWLEETGSASTAFIRHVEQSPLRSRVIGYHDCNGISHEWHCPHSRYLPGNSAPMKRALGNIPDVERRIHTTVGVLRDPAREGEVIDYYRKFHELCSEKVIHFARLTKDASGGRVLAGTFFLYFLENIWIQEAGHLAPEPVLA